MKKFNNYIEDFSIFNHSHVDTSSTLFMNYAYGILTLLNFEGLDTFIDDNKDIIVNENNSTLTLYFDNKIFFYMKPTIINLLFAAVLFFGKFF